MADMERHQILRSLLSDVGAPYRHYTLRITGHSLGAGCATLIGYIYRQKYPSLRVIAISPPGSFLTWRLATKSNEFVTSFVLDSDLVPRLTVHSMEHLRNEVLNIFGRIKVPKSHVAKNFIVNTIIKANEDDSIDPDYLAKLNDEMLYPHDSSPLESEFHLQCKRFQEIQNARRENRGGYRNIKLYPPGKIVQLVKVRIQDENDQRYDFLLNVTSNPFQDGRAGKLYAKLSQMCVLFYEQCWLRVYTCLGK
jgi:sn1-specific diacylglycerol lipase